MIGLTIAFCALLSFTLVELHKSRKISKRLEEVEQTVREIYRYFHIEDSV